MLHSSKGQAILQWFNCLTTNVNIQSLSQFADGSLFYDIALSIDPEAEKKSPSAQVDEESSANEEQIFESSAKRPKLRSSKHAETGKRSVRTATEMQKNYDYIKKVLDGFFDIDSGSLISYSDCMNHAELELAKVTMLLLSAMVLDFLSSENKSVDTMTLLDPQIQEDIKDCLSLVINERKKENPLKKSEFEKVLARSARYKGTPRRKSQKTIDMAMTPDTPHSLTKRNRDRIEMDDTQESPLKKLLQSPITLQHKTAFTMVRKDAEIAKLRNALDVEEMKVQDLEIKSKNMDNELEKKTREIKLLKDKLQAKEEEAEDNIKTLEGVKNLELTQFIASNEKLKLDLQNQKEEMKAYEVANEALKCRIGELEGKLSQNNSAEFIAGNELVAELTKKVEAAEEEILTYKDEMSKLKEHVESLKKYKLMFEEKTAEATSTPKTPRFQETVKDIMTEFSPSKEYLKKEEEFLALIHKLQEEIKEKQSSSVAAEKEKSDLLQKIETLNFTVNVLESKLGYYRSRETMALKPKSESSVDNEADLPDSQSSEIESTVTTTQPPEEEIGILWKRSCKSSSSIKTSGKKSLTDLTEDSKYWLTEADSESLKQQSRDLLDSLHMAGVAVDPQLEKQLCSMSSATDFVAALSNILQHVKNKLNPAAVPLAETSPQRKRRSRTVDTPDLDPAALVTQIKSLTTELVKVKAACKKQVDDKDLKIRAIEAKYENLMDTEKVLKDSFDRFKKEAHDVSKKYEFAKKSMEKLKLENRKITRMCFTLKKEYDKEKATWQSCSKCDNLQNQLTETKEDLRQLRQEKNEVKGIAKSLESRIGNLDRQTKELIKENERLKFQIQRESAFMSGNASARNNVILKYLKDGFQECDRKARAEKEIQLEQKTSGPVMNFNTYILPTEKKDSCAETSFANNTFGNRSIRGGFFQTDDEEDFLNHSSLAEIRSGVFTESEGNRFSELKRRNTLCPPHLQSCYPLEIQDMTPSEKKYYERQSLAFPSKRPYSTEQEVYDKPQSSFLGASYNNSQNSCSLVNKKQKVSNESSASTSFMKKEIKPKTPARQTGSLTKSHGFKTPSSIRRLIRMPSRKNKQH